MSLKSASPITLLPSQVLGHRVNSLNLAPQPILGSRVAPKAYRPLREEVAVRTRKASREVRSPGLHLLCRFKDVGALCDSRFFSCV